MSFSPYNPVAARKAVHSGAQSAVAHAKSLSVKHISIIAFVAWFCLSSNTPGLVIVSVASLLSIISGIAIWRSIQSATFSNLLQLGSHFITLGHNLAFVTAVAMGGYFTLPLEHIRLSLQLRPESYVFAIQYSMAFAAALELFGHLEGLSPSNLSKVLHRFANVNEPTFAKLLFALTGVQFVMFLTDFWLYRGYAGASEDGRLIWWSDIVQNLIYFDLIVVAEFAARAFQRRRQVVSYLPIGVAFTCLTLLRLVTLGRREIMYGGLAIIMFYSFFSLRRDTKRLRPLVLISVGFAILQMMVTNLSLRAVMVDENSSSLTYRALSAFTSMVQDRDYRRQAYRDSSDNYSKRLLIAGGFALVRDQKPEGTLSGEDLVNSLVVSFPTILTGPKVYFPIQENLIMRRLGLSLGDITDSIYLSAYLDFHFCGLLTHSVLLVVLIRTIATGASRSASPILSVFAISPWFYALTIGINESSLSSYFRLCWFSLVVVGIGNLIALVHRSKH